ncbi:glycosyltransferase [Paenibacillus piscarius]|uniref:glycosyltransferase n=1 Tax=Paenibacillus piscarius TaxID=1089681 RepID=UPI001EE788C4
MNTTVRPTLGVQLIVKNEAELLPRCLATLQGADEIIVVDTGSTDQSIAIAAKYGATVVEEPWADDFSAARNTGLAQAASDWVLVLDADETLQHSIESIKDRLRDSAAEAYTVRIENLLGSRPEDRLFHSNVRLFRNGQGYQFHGRIHERIDDSIISRHGAAAIEASDIGILHYGYLPGIMSAKNKISRNEQILRLALAEKPDDPFYTYNLAVTCCQDGRLQEAGELLRRTLDTASLQVSYRPSAIRDLCTIYQATGQLQALDSLLSCELARYPDYPDLQYIQGQSWESQGHFERAVQSYQHALDSASSPAPQRAYVTEQGMNSFRPLHRMGVIAQQLGNQEEAARLFHRALQHHNLYLPALEGIASAFQALAVKDEEIAGLLIRLAGTEQRASRSAIIGTLYKLGAYQAIAKLPPGQFPLEEDTLLCILSSWIISGKYHAYMQAAARLRAGTLQLSAAGLDAETVRQLWLLEAVSAWELGEKLPEDVWQQAPAELRSGLCRIDEQLVPSGQGAGIAGLQAPAAPPVDAALLGEVIRLAVKLEYTTLGNTLAERFPSHTSVLAEALYEEGWRAEAGELFIRLVDRKEASGPSLRYLAELLADQGHYTEAAGWYRLALEEAPGSEVLHAGLALCYLRLAELGLKEVTGSLGQEQVQGPLQEDLAAVTRSITVLSRTPWHTQWTCKQQQRGAELSI